MDRLTSMSVFARTAEVGSFAAAARDLGLSPTMIGKHIRHLEAHLGARLINRTTRSQSLTELGEAYLGHCRRALEEIEEADALVAQTLSVPRGSLRVTSSVSFGPQDLADHNCIGFALWARGGRWSFRGPDGECSVAVKSRFQTNGGFGMRHAALAGAGIALLPEVLVEKDLAEKRLTRVLPDYVPPSQPMHVVWLASKKLTPKLHRFPGRDLWQQISPYDAWTGCPGATAATRSASVHAAFSPAARRPVGTRADTAAAGILTGIADR